MIMKLIVVNLIVIFSNIEHFSVYIYIYIYIYIYKRLLIASIFLVFDYQDSVLELIKDELLLQFSSSRESLKVTLGRLRDTTACSIMETLVYFCICMKINVDQIEKALYTHYVLCSDTKHFALTQNHFLSWVFL